MDQTVSSICTPTPFTVSSHTVIRECIRLMRELRISCLVVCDDGLPVGIYTEADMVRTLNRLLDYDQVTIGDLMSSPLVTAPGNMHIYDATNLLSSHKIRHLVVVNPDQTLAGILTQTDIIAHYGEDYFVGARYVANVMNRKVLLVAPDARVSQVINQMEYYATGCAIAIQDNRPQGILTERDMAALMIDGREIERLAMDDVMASPVITTMADTSTVDAVNLMNQKKVRRLVVVDEQNIVTGVLVQEDIVRNLETNYARFLKDSLQQQQRVMAQLRQDYSKSNRQLNSLLNSPLGLSIMVMDLSFTVQFVNCDGLELFDLQERPVMYQPLDQLLQSDCIHEHVLETIREEVKVKGAYWFVHLRSSQNKIHHIESRLMPMYEQEQLTGYILVSQDITNRLHTEKQLLQASHFFENAIEGIMVTDVNGTIQAVNPAFTQITGYEKAEVLGNNPRILRSDRQGPEFYQRMWEALRTDGQWQGEIWNRRKNGEIYPQHMAISSVRDLNGHVVQYSSVFYDITEMKENEQRVNHHAYHDPLTELPNRLLFNDRVDQAIIRARRCGHKLAVIFIDLDNFKRLNDTLGHRAGDQLLQHVSLNFRGLLRDQDTVSRFAGDEFTVLLEDIDAQQSAIEIARRILDMFNQPFSVKGKDVFLGASLGIACYPTDGCNTEVLLKNADMAMTHAKESGRNNYCVFHSQMAAEVTHRVELENQLRKALENQQLQIVYQPILNLHTRRIVSTEALLRWDKAGLPSSPSEFIPVAEESGLIVPIGEWVLRQTCETINRCQVDGDSGLAVSVNLSARQFREKALLASVERILQETGLNPAQLHLEITETSVMADMKHSIDIMYQLKALGVCILLDDFGTGYSSLTCLRQFPVDVLKLDHTFIHNIDKTEDAARLAAGIISIAKDMRLQVVAEGVENKQQLAFLEQQGCDMVQGYLFHRPLSAQALSDLLKMPEERF